MKDVKEMTSDEFLVELNQALEKQRLAEQCGEKLFIENIKLKERLSVIRHIVKAPASDNKSWQVGDICDGQVVFWVCPYCDFALQLIEGEPQENEYNYCPKCGHDMRGVEE